MTVISTADQFDRALSQASAGATLYLDPTFQYTAPIVITIPITIVNSVPLPVQRMTLGPKLPQFLGKTIFVNGGKAIGIEFRNANHLDNIVEAYGVWQFDRCRMLGDPTLGCHRGLAAFPAGNSRVVRCYFDDCFLPAPGQDAMAVGMWQGYGLTIQDNFLRAGSQSVFLGGADVAENLMPNNVTIMGNTITANPKWLGKPIGVKARLELKNCRNVLIERNEIRYCWAQGQDGILVKLNVRNQDGSAPWSTITDVTIRNNECAEGATAIGILGTDYSHPSGRMARVLIQGNRFTGLNPDKYTQDGNVGRDQLILIEGGPDDLTIDSNKFDMVRPPSSQVYFDWSGTDRHKCQNLQIINNRWPKSTYGIFGGEGSANNINNSVWNAFVESGTLSGNTEF